MAAELRPQAIPLSVDERTRFLRARFNSYFSALTDRSDDPSLFAHIAEDLTEEAARNMAWSLAYGDLLAILGRTGARSFRIQLATETSTLSTFKLEA